MNDESTLNLSRSLEAKVSLSAKITEIKSAKVSKDILRPSCPCVNNFMIASCANHPTFWPRWNLPKNLFLFIMQSNIWKKLPLARVIIYKEAKLDSVRFFFSWRSPSIDDTKSSTWRGKRTQKRILSQDACPIYWPSLIKPLVSRSRPAFQSKRKLPNHFAIFIRRN